MPERMWQALLSGCRGGCRTEGDQEVTGVAPPGSSACLGLTVAPGSYRCSHRLMQGVFMLPQPAFTRQI